MKTLDASNTTLNQQVEQTKLQLKIKNAKINIDNNVSIKDIKKLSKEVSEIHFKRFIY